MPGKKYLIIGQGIAGSMMAWALEQRGADYLIIDNNHQGSSSMVSAGVINPITGKRLILTPHFDTFYQTAVSSYQQCATILGQPIFIPTALMRVLKNHEEWLRYGEIKDNRQYRAYIKQDYLPGQWSKNIHDPYGMVEHTASGYVRTQALLTGLKEFFKNNSRLVQGSFNLDEMKIIEGGVCWQGENFKGVVFCQGYQAMGHPLFDTLRFKPVKGDILRLKLKNGSLPQVIYNHVKWCVPLGNDEWLAGATYQWDDLSLMIHEHAAAEILAGLKEFIHLDWTILDHQTGIRPAMIDQQPVVKRHERYPQVAIINGLGSKGFLMAPLLAQRLCEEFLR